MVGETVAVRAPVAGAVADVVADAVADAVAVGVGVRLGVRDGVRVGGVRLCGGVGAGSSGERKVEQARVAISRSVRLRATARAG